MQFTLFFAIRILQKITITTERQENTLHNKILTTVSGSNIDLKKLFGSGVLRAFESIIGGPAPA